MSTLGLRGLLKSFQPKAEVSLGGILATLVCVFLHFRDVSVLPRNVHQNYPGAEQKCIFLGPLQTRSTSVSRRGGGGAGPVFSPRESLSLPGTGLCRARRPGPSPRSLPRRQAPAHAALIPASAPPLSPPSVPPELGSCLGFRPAAHNKTEVARSPEARCPARAQPSPPARPAAAEVTARVVGRSRPFRPAPRPGLSAPLSPPLPLPSHVRFLSACLPLPLPLSPSSRFLSRT